MGLLLKMRVPLSSGPPRRVLSRPYHDGVHPHVPLCVIRVRATVLPVARLIPGVVCRPSTQARRAEGSRVRSRPYCRQSEPTYAWGRRARRADPPGSDRLHQRRREPPPGRCASPV